MMSSIGAVERISSGWQWWRNCAVDTTAGKAKLNPDFSEFIELLNELEVRDLIVGGYAVVLYVYPRYTRSRCVDLDRYCQCREAGLALARLGFGSLESNAAEFLDPDRIIRLGYPPNRIDLLTRLDGVTFEDCYPHRVMVDIEGVEAAFIDPETLKRNKAASGRI